MKNLDGLMSEDRENTLNMIKDLYESKMKTVKVYFHSIAIFLIASLGMLIVFEYLREDFLFWTLFVIMISVGLLIFAKALIEARGYKELIDTYTIK